MDDRRIDIPTLETDRLILRKLVAEDAADIFAYASDPEVARLSTWEPHRSIDDTRAFLERVFAWYDEGFGGPWGLALKSERSVIGTCGLAVVPAHARAEPGYAIGRLWQGRGLMTEAVRAAIRYGFEDLGLNRLEARCVPENLPSERVMQKAGMSYEGLLREQLFVKGKFDDLKMYSILRREWDAARQAGGRDG